MLLTLLLLIVTNPNPYPDLRYISGLGPGTPEALSLTQSCLFLIIPSRNLYYATGAKSMDFCTKTALRFQDGAHTPLENAWGLAGSNVSQMTWVSGFTESTMALYASRQEQPVHHGNNTTDASLCINNTTIKKVTFLKEDEIY